MPMTVEQLAAEATHLPPSAQAELVEKILSNFDAALDPELEERWAAESVHRFDELQTGRVEGIPADDVLAEGRRIAGR